MAVIDYLSGVVQGKTDVEVLNYAGLYVQSWVQGKGSHGYRKSWCAPGFRVYYDGAPDMGVYLQISGEGCGEISNGVAFMSWGRFAEDFRSFGFRASRVDVAYDDREGILTVEEVIRKRRSREYTSKWRTYREDVGGVGEEVTKSSIYFGSMEGDTSLNIYNKRLERLAKGFPDPGHWVRAELRYKHRAAEEFLSWVVGNPDLAGAEGFLSAAISFRDSTEDTNAARWPISQFWQDFCANSEKHRVHLKRAVRTLQQHCDRFVRQHSATLAMLVLCMCQGTYRGKWLDDLLYTGWGRMNKQQVALVRETLHLTHNSGLLPLHGGVRNNE